MNVVHNLYHFFLSYTLCIRIRTPRPPPTTQRFYKIKDSNSKYCKIKDSNSKYSATKVLLSFILQNILNCYPLFYKIFWIAILDFIEYFELRCEFYRIPDPHRGFPHRTPRPPPSFREFSLKSRKHDRWK